MGALIALALAQAAAAPAAKPGAVQQAFDAAAALDASGTPVARADAWATLAERARGNRRTVAIAHLRQGAALADQKRWDEAEALVRAALPDIPKGDATLKPYRYDAAVLLGGAAENALDYADAASRYADAEADAGTPAERFVALLGRVRTAAYVAPADAQAAAARADALATGATVDVTVQGILRRFEAELAMNRGDWAAAKRLAGEAVKLMGGLTDRTDSNDVSVRSDYAIAALMTGAPDAAREYMAMTGAGRLPDGVFGRGVDVATPDCGGEADLKPADLAVVEFTVADDGRTEGVRPVYAAGGGAAALAFAQAVSRWSWTPEQLRSVPVFFRNRVRLELRCSTSFERPSVASFFDANLARWLSEHDLEPAAPPAESDAAALAPERAMLAAAVAKSGPDSPGTLPALWLLLRNRVTPPEERRAVSERAQAILKSQGAPPRVRIAAALPAIWTGAHGRGAKPIDALRALYADYGADGETRGALALVEADLAERDPDRVRALLRPVARDATLEVDDPVRSAALVRLASLEERARRPDEARALYADAHVAPDACALIDSPPRMLSAGGVFPEEARRWGFEGWALVQYDISPAGRTSNERAIMAYPPFVFTQAAVKTMAGAQFAKTFRPDGQSGCGGDTKGVKFRM